MSAQCIKHNDANLLQVQFRISDARKVFCFLSPMWGTDRRAKKKTTTRNKTTPFLVVATVLASLLTGNSRNPTKNIGCIIRPCCASVLVSPKLYLAGPGVHPAAVDQLQ